MIGLDGNYCEGGGSIVRVALALSTITQKPFKVNNIRKGRCTSGLKNQHLYCVEALKKLCNADVKGAEIGSHYVEYSPGKIQGKTISIDIETAGSVTLLLQALLVPCCFADKKVRLRLKGGTDVKWSMPFDYFKEVLLPQLRKYADIDVSLLKRGYYPKGNGKVDITIKPKYNINDFKGFDDFWDMLKKENKKINLTEQGNLVQIKGISHAAKELEKAEVAERQAKTAKLMLNRMDCPVNIDVEYSSSLCAGSGIMLYAIFSKDKDEIDFLNPIRIGSDSLGERGKRAEIVGKEAAERLINEINYKAPVDEYLADNLIPWLALFGEKMRVAKISNHLLTNVYVVEKFLGKMFKVNEKEKIVSAN